MPDAMKPEKPEAHVAALHSSARSPVQDVQEPVSTEATDEKSWQQMPDAMKPEKPEAQVAAVQSDARSPVHDVQEPVSTEATDEKS